MPHNNLTEEIVNVFLFYINTKLNNTLTEFTEQGIIRDIKSMSHESRINQLVQCIKIINQNYSQKEAQKRIQILQLFLEELRKKCKDHLQRENIELKASDFSTEIVLSRGENNESYFLQREELVQRFVSYEKLLTDLSAYQLLDQKAILSAKIARYAGLVAAIAAMSFFLTACNNIKSTASKTPKKQIEMLEGKGKKITINDYLSSIAHLQSLKSDKELSKKLVKDSF